MYDETEGARFALEDAVLTMTFDRAGKRNALRDEDVVAFSDALVQANNDERVRAVLVTGAGGDFCAGADIVDRNQEH